MEVSEAKLSDQTHLVEVVTPGVVGHLEKLPVDSCANTEAPDPPSMAGRRPFLSFQLGKLQVEKRTAACDGMTPQFPLSLRRWRFDSLTYTCLT